MPYEMKCPLIGFYYLQNARYILEAGANRRTQIAVCCRLLCDDGSINTLLVMSIAFKIFNVSIRFIQRKI